MSQGKIFVKDTCIISILILYSLIMYIIIKTDMNASWMLVYYINSWLSQGKIIRMSQGNYFIILPCDVLPCDNQLSVIYSACFVLGY